MSGVVDPSCCSEAWSSAAVRIRGRRHLFYFIITSRFCCYTVAIIVQLDYTCIFGLETVDDTKQQVVADEVMFLMMKQILRITCVISLWCYFQMWTLRCLYMWRVFSPSAADLINRQLMMAECAACRPPLWLGGSPPFCGLGSLCPEFPPLFPPLLRVYISLGIGGLSWGGD